MEQLPIGAEIGGYRLIRVAGRGAIGVVYVAEHIHLGRVAAVKTLGAAVAGEAEFQERFIREARSAAAIDHPHIVPIYDAGEEDGVLFLVMRYVDGSDVAQLLEAQGGPLDVDLTLSIGGQIAGALDAANRKGLIHRDVKPANILLEQHTGGQPHSYLTDFGLTKHAQASTLTRAGQFVGTLLYMAPEQIEGHPVSGSSDLYSLACVLWECLVGLPPFLPKGGSNLSLLSAHTLEPVPRITERRPDLPAALDQVFLTALAKAPEARHASAAAFVDVLREALEGWVRPAPIRPTLTPADPDSDTARVQLGPSDPRPPTLPDTLAARPPSVGATPAPAAVTGPLGPPGAPADDEDGETFKIKPNQLAEAQEVVNGRSPQPGPAPPAAPGRPAGTGAVPPAAPVDPAGVPDDSTARIPGSPSPQAPAGPPATPRPYGEPAAGHPVGGPTPGSPAGPVPDDRMPTARFDAPPLAALPPTGQSGAPAITPGGGRAPEARGPADAGPAPARGVPPTGSTAGAVPANPWAAAPNAGPTGLPPGGPPGGRGDGLPPGAARDPGAPPATRRRARWPWIVVAALVLAAVIVAIVLLTGGDGTDVSLAEAGATGAAAAPTTQSGDSADAVAVTTAGAEPVGSAAGTATAQAATDPPEGAGDPTAGGDDPTAGTDEPAPSGESATGAEPPVTGPSTTVEAVIGATGVTEEVLAGQDPLQQGPIALVSRRDGNAEIYLVTADGSGLRRLTDDPADDAQPAWSPDGTRIAFSSDRGGSRAIWAMAPDGSAATQVSLGPDDADPAWNPDGTQIVFSRGVPNGRELVVITLADGSERTLGVTAAFAGAANALRPAWAPDGSAIAYQVDGSGDFDIWTVRPDGAGARRALGVPGAGDFHPAWAPDGSGILFTSDRDGSQDLWVAGPDGSQETRMALSTADRDERDGDFSTGGGHLTYVLATGDATDLAVARSVGTDPPTLIPGTPGDSDPSWLR